MKNKLLVASMLLGSFAFSQSRNIRPATFNHLKIRSNSSLNHEKSLSCQDTLRYPQLKEQVIGGGNFAVFDAWKAYGESISMGFQNSTSLTINTVEFYGGNSPDGVATVTAKASIYSVDASFTPVTLLGSGTLSISDTNFSYRYVNLSAPVTVTGNYAVVISANNTNGVVRYFVNDPTPSQTYDETMSFYKSSYYATSGGAFVTIPTLLSGTYNFEPLVAPIVSYSINTTFTAAPTSVCLGSAVTFSNTTTPMSVFQNRFESYQAFAVYFGAQVSDSSFAYLFGDNSNPGWGSNLTYTYGAAGVYTDTLVSLGGFWNSCLDYSTQSVTVNPIDDASFSYPSYTVCSGSSNPVATASTSGTFSSTSGLNFVSTSTGEIDMTTSSDGTYVISHTTAGICPATANQTLTITSAPDATFSYSAAAYCQNDSDPSPTFTTGSAGTFSSTIGIVLNGSGMVDVSASAPGTYTVSNTIAASGSCPAITETQDITINAVPVISFNPLSAMCVLDSPLTLTASPVGGTYSGAAVSGNSFDPQSAGVGSFTINYSYTDGNGCSSSATQTVTVNSDIVPSFAMNSSYCVGENASLPGTSVNGISGTWNPSVISTVTSGTTSYTFTPNSGQCADATTVDITVTDNPTVTFDNVNDLCVYNAAVTLSGTPSGGTFAGTGVSGTSFDPAVSGTGTFTLTYSYTDLGGCSASQSQDVMVDACLGLEESNLTEIVAYPNPSTKSLTISYDAADSQLKLISTDGKILFAANYHGNVETTIDISEFAPAVYHLIVSTESGTQTLKILKQ